MSRVHTHRWTLFLAAGIASTLGACRAEETPGAPPPAASRPPAAPLASKRDAAARPKSKLPPPPNDGLSLMERVAKRRAAEAKLAADLAAQEKQRVRKYDKRKLALHTKLLAFVKKTRKQLDDAAASCMGKPTAAAQIAKLQVLQEKAMQAHAKLLASIDPKGGNSMVVNDHDVMLNALAGDYPAAIVTSCQGNEEALAEQRAEMDKRLQKVEAWLGEVKNTP